MNQTFILFYYVAEMLMEILKIFLSSFINHDNISRKHNKSIFSELSKDTKSLQVYIFIK